MPDDTPTPSSPTDQPTAPMPPTPEPSAHSQPAPMRPVVTGSGRRKLKKPLLIVGGAVVAAVLVGGGLVFGLYLPNTPENVYSAGLENTGKAFDQLVDYSKTLDNAHYKGAAFDGTMKYKSGQGSFDFDMNGSGDNDGNLTANMDLDLMGNKGSASIRSVHVQGNTSPDLYFQVNGIKSYLDGSGMGALDSLDGQWISIDHTLIDTYASQLGSMSPVDINATTPPTFAQIQDAETKVQAVNKQYLFTTNASTAVLANEKYLGQTKDGSRTLNHYQVGYNRDHFEAYAKALAAALNSSSLNDWSKKANKGKNLSDVLDFTSMENDIKSAKADYTFGVWVDTGTKLVSKVTFTNPEDTPETFTFAQSYTGGDDYPFSIAFNGKDDSGNPEQFTMQFSVNTKTNKVSAGIDVTSKDDTGTSTVNVSVSATPSMNAVKVTPPTGAKSVSEILNELGLGGLVSGLPAGGSSSDTPLFFQQ